MIPINSASQFESFLTELKVYTQSIDGSDYPCFKLYAKFPNQHNSVINYGEWHNERGGGSSGIYTDERYLPYLEAGLAPYYIKESTPLEVNGKIITKERFILTYAPFDQVVFYGAELPYSEHEKKFLEWRKSKAASESE